MLVWPFSVNREKNVLGNNYTDVEGCSFCEYLNDYIISLIRVDSRKNVISIYLIPSIALQYFYDLESNVVDIISLNLSSVYTHKSATIS